MSVTVTFTGCLVIFVAIAVYFLRPAYLLPLLVFSAAFPAVSVLDISIGDYLGGLSAFYFITILMSIRLAASSLRIHRLLPERHSGAYDATRLLMWLWLWAVASAFICPWLFRGIVVLSPRAGIPEISQVLASGDYGEPLHWTTSNLAQVLFLTLDIAAIIYAARTAGPNTARRTVSALRVALGLVTAIAIVQVLAAASGWNFPYGIFNTNPTWSRLYSENIGTLNRVSSTFSEPSVAGGFLAAGLLALIAERVAVRPRHLRSLGALACVLVALLSTTASTGYATAIIGALLMIFFIRNSGGLAVRKAGFVDWLAAFGAVTFVACGAFLVSPSLLRAAASMTIEKINTGSFSARIISDLYALSIFRSSYGLGVGLGSNRPSSLVTYLLSNLGIIGCVLFFLAALKIVQKLGRVRARRTGISAEFVLWMTLGWLIAQMVAIPDLTFAPLWAILATAVTLLWGPEQPGRVILQDQLPLPSQMTS